MSQASSHASSSAAARHSHPLQNVHQMIHNDASGPAYITLSGPHPDSVTETDGDSSSSGRKRRRLDKTSNLEAKRTYRLGDRFVFHSSTDKTERYWKVRLYGTLIREGQPEIATLALWKGYMTLEQLGQSSRGSKCPCSFWPTPSRRASASPDRAATYPGRSYACSAAE